MTSPPADAAVAINRLVKEYAGRRVVNELSLTAARGAITAVLGPNGAGKTTTIECCEGLRSPDSGTVRVLDLDPRLDGSALRPRVGVMLQDGGLPTATPAGALLEHVAKMYRDPRPTPELSERLGLAPFARTSVRRLSGGQRQRLALAIALVGRPEVVFLDEPSAGMDPQTRHAVWQLIKELRAGGTSFVLTTHDMEEATALADDVVIMDRGAVLACGTVAELTGEHTAQHLTVTVKRPARAGNREDAGVTHFKPVPSPSRDDELTVSLPAADRLRIDGHITPQLIAQVAQHYAAHDVQILDMSISARSLEDVFLDLTGRNLR